MHKPLTSIEIYKELLKLKPVLDQFKETREATLKPNEVEIMLAVYPSLKVLAGGHMAINLCATCPAQLREALHIYVSVFDRMSADETINPDANSNPLESTAPPVSDFLTEDEEQALLRLLHYVATDDEPTPDPAKYLRALEDYIDALPDSVDVGYLQKLYNKTEQLEAVIASLPEPEEVIVTPKDVLVPPVVTEAQEPIEGNALNTPETTTPEQKTARTKEAKKIAKK